MTEAVDVDGLGPARAQLPMDRRQSLARDKEMPEETVGAALFADVSGFTGLSQDFARQSGMQRGAEALAEAINPIYDQLIRRVHAFGGSVICYSGDAITCWFDEAADAPSGGAVRRAVTCATAIQTAMEPFARFETPWGTTASLGVKVFVASGSARRFLVGDPDRRVHDLLVGSTLDRVAATKVHVAKGEILVGQEVAELLGEDLRLRAWREDKESGLRFGVVESIDPPAEPMPWPDVDTGALAERALRAWLPGPVFDRLRSGPYLAELRRAIPMFVQFEGIDYDGDELAGQKLDSVARWMQQVVDRYEGHLLQLTFGDKGSLAIICFGAPTAHEDDSERAVSAALALLELSDTHDFVKNMRIGMSRGQLWSGCYGAEDRSCYSILGAPVNLAARLMTMAAPGSVVITQDLVDAVGEGYRIQHVGEVSMKDGSEPVRVAAVLERHAVARTPVMATTDRGLVGRLRELAQLQEALDALEERRSGVVIIEGEAGIGKSHLVAELIGRGEERGIEHFFSFGGAIARATPYFVWRPIVRHAFRLGPNAKPATDQKRVLRALSLLGDEQVERAPLLNTVLGLEIPETELTSSMEARARADARHGLIIQALQEELLDEPMLLVLDDAHWIDSASWALLHQLRLELEPLLIVIATRPMRPSQGDGTGVPEVFAELAGDPGTVKIDLGEMAAEETLSLVAQRLGCRELPEIVAELIVERANGNPFFSEELGYDLRDRGFIRVVDGECRIGGALVDGSNPDLPDSIQSVITQRIDLLAPGTQLAAKVASVIGRVFECDTLQRIYPGKMTDDDVDRHLSVLEALEITPLESPDAADRYIFKHALTQEVAYGLMAFSQRRELHRAMAEWVGQQHADELAPYYGLLAHHWERAEHVANSVKFLGLAGTQALDNFANREAVEFLERAIEQSDRKSTAVGAAVASIDVGPLQRGRWERQLGDAHFRMGRLEESEARLRASLGRLGWPVPSDPEGLAIDVGAVLTQENWRRVLKEEPAAATMDEDERARTRLAYRNYDHLIEVAFLNGDPALTLYCTFKALEMAELLGPSDELAQAYAKISFTLSFVPMIDLARHYMGLAMDLIADSDDPIALANVTLPLGVFTAGIGDWDETESLIGTACDIFERFGNWPRWGLCKQVQLRMALHRASFEEMGQIAEQHAQFGERHHNVEHQLWGLRDKGHHLLLTSDDAAGAVRLLSEAMALCAHGGDRAALGMSQALIANAHHRRGDTAAALEAASRALEMAEESPPTSFGQFTTYAYMAEALSDLLEDGASDARLSAMSERACVALEGFAATFPIGRPRASLFRGLQHHRSGDGEAATESWREGLEEAERQGAEYELALIRRTIGQHLPRGDAQRQAYLEQAEQSFATLGASHDLTLTRRALAG